MRRIASWLFAFALCAALLVVPTTSRHIVPMVYAGTGCTDATLTGNYMFNFSGFGTRGSNPKGNELPVGAVGVFTFDGAGNHSTSFTFVQNAVVSTGNTASGIYSVNSDCTGSITWTGGQFAGVTFYITANGDGSEIYGIETDTTAGITATFDAKKQ